MQARTRWWIVAASFVATATLLLLNRSPYGDLASWYTDHLHHAHATWVALHRGIAIYDRPFREALAGVPFRHATPTWDFMPGMVYPPGVLAIFAPLSLVGQYLPMARPTFGLLLVLYTLAIAHLAFAAVLAALAATRPAGAGVILGALCWMMLMRMGMNGFFDGAWLACGAMMVQRLATGRATSALRWFALAMTLHFRAVILVPLALAALWRALHGRRPRAWPWIDLALLALALFLCLGTFALTLPVTSAYREQRQSLLQLHSGMRFWLVVGLGVAGTALAWWWADVVVAATVAGATLLGLVHVDFWWHGSVALFAPLAVAALGPGRAPSRARAALVVWLLCLQPLAWREAHDAFVTELADKLVWRFGQPDRGEQRGTDERRERRPR